MQTPTNEVPSREILQRAADILTREAVPTGEPDAKFVVSPDGTELEFHIRLQSRDSVVRVPVTLQGEELCILLPDKRLACFQTNRFLDTQSPNWTN